MPSLASATRRKAPAAPAAPAVQSDEAAGRTVLLHRLRRAEGQLRGIQRMVEEGQPCLAVAAQMAAVRKALDSAYVQLTLQFLARELGALPEGPAGPPAVAAVLGEVQALLGTVR